LKNYTKAESQILMVLSDVCDLERIKAIGKTHQWDFNKILEKSVWADGKNYLFWIKPLE